MKRLCWFLGLLMACVFYANANADADAQAELDMCSRFKAVAQSHSPNGGFSSYDSAIMVQKATGPLAVGFNPGSSFETNPSCSNGSSTGYCTFDLSKIVAPFPKARLYHEQRPLIVENKIFTLGEGGICQEHNPAQCSYLNLSVKNAVLNIEPGTYWFNRIELNNNSQINISNKGKVTIYARSANVQPDVTFVTNNIADDFLFWLKESSSLGGTGSYNATIYGEQEISLHHDVQLNGSVVAENLKMYSAAKLTGESRCFSKGLFVLNLSSNSTSTDSCSRIPIDFSIIDTHGGLRKEMFGPVTVKVTSSTPSACWSTTETGPCTGLSKTVNIVNGRARLWLQNTASGIVNVQASYNLKQTNELLTKTGVYSFVSSTDSFRFVAPLEKDTIAGKAQLLTIEAVDKVEGSCARSGNINTTYNGAKKLEIGNARYIKPAYASKFSPIKPSVNGAVGPQIINVNFVNGRAENVLNVVYSDAGLISIPVRDVTDKPVKEKETKTPSSEKPPRTGAVELNVRPYTFSICDLNATNNPSLAAGAFSVAGAPFSVSLRPIIWQEGDLNDNGIVNLDDVSKNYCSRPITPSFAQLDAIEATISISNRDIVMPSGGIVPELNGIKTKTNKDALNGVYHFSDLTLEDVGTFKIGASLTSSYLGMTINPSQLSVGRFYPSHFAMTSRNFIDGVPANSDALKKGFTYMNQPFWAEYKISPMTFTNKAVKNYHLFTGANEKATFDDWVIHPSDGYPYTGTDLTERWSIHPMLDLQNPWTERADGVSEVNISGNMVFQKGGIPDGPFSPLRFAVGVKNEDRDKTQFKFCAQPGQPNCSDKVIKSASGDKFMQEGAQFGSGDFLFGFMRIEGFTETEDLSRPRKMPVTIETFNGSHFAVNTRDNFSVVSTIPKEQKTVLFSDTSDPLMQAKVVLLKEGTSVEKSSAVEVQTKTVQQGRSFFTVIPQHKSPNAIREQFKYLLKLNDGLLGNLPQTWLQNNWQGAAFDGNPSAIGTYGFYRGSDRIIYREEQNTTMVEE